MERLTKKKEADAQRRAYEKRLEQGYPRSIPEERFLRLAAYEDTGLEPEDVTGLMAAHGTAIGAIAKYRALGTVEELSALVKAQAEGLIQPMICTGCRYDRTESLAEHEAHCMRCIRNRYPEDHYTRAEAEAALGWTEAQEDG